MKNLLIELRSCEEAREWAGNKTAEEVINECHRGDWLLWLAKKMELDIRLITLAKGQCANMVRHLMKDERSIKAVDAAIAFGRGEIEIDELNAYADAADAAAYAADAAAAAAYAAAAAAYAADAADAAADAAAAAAAAADAAAADAAAAAADAAADAADADAADAAAYAAAAAARKKNRMLTANICREVFGKELLLKIKNKLKTK